MAKVQRRRLVMVVASVALSAGLVAPAPSLAVRSGSEGLPLGPAGLEETRTSTELAPGVIHTEVRRGHPSPNDFFTVDVALFVRRAGAESTVRRLHRLGYGGRIVRIEGRAPDDPRPGPTGYLVQVGRFGSQERADAVAENLIAEGYPDAAGTHTSLDGGPTTGPWVVNIFDIDLRRWDGELTPVLGTDIVPGLERLTDIAERFDPLAAINGGYFVIEPVDGTPGDLAGIGVEDGRLISEAVNGRTSLLLSEDPGEVAAIKALRTRLRAISAGGGTRAVDGLNRKPGLIRSCGGVGGDIPTQRPKHDFTCTDGSELILFTPDFGSNTESGPGVEAVLDAAGRVIALRNGRGGAIPEDGSVLAATGADARWLRHHAVIGQRMRVLERVLSGSGGVPLRDGLGIINGGPRLLRHGRSRITAFREGFVHLDDPFFYVAFGLRRNPRTIAGITADHHLLLVAIDGRQPDWSVGASFVEEARVMRSLGAVSSVNLDGGGSTTVTIGDDLINRPSDEEGERPIGDALLLLP
ncbi:MAG: phosphodiester glycosidase family protein [Actinomycetota bacterium]|nr:phosphodiester glycosidase family protein [Actinomycetota bacterium]